MIMELKKTYTSEEGMEIAREFVGEVLSSSAKGDFSFLAVIGSVARKNKRKRCGDIDMAVAGKRANPDDWSHPIRLIQQDYRKAGKKIDIIPVPEFGISERSFALIMFHRYFTLRSLNEAIPIYESPVGYSEKLKSKVRKYCGLQEVH